MSQRRMMRGGRLIVGTVVLALVGVWAPAPPQVPFVSAATSREAVPPTSGSPASGEPAVLGSSTAARPVAVSRPAPVGLKLPTPTSSTAAERAAMVGKPAVMPAPVKDDPQVGFDATKAVEDVSQRTQFTKLLVGPDGRAVVELSTMALHYQDKTGRWLEIDNHVVRDGAGRLTNAANEWRVVFEPMVPGRGVSFWTPDGEIRFVAENASPVEPVVEPDGVSVRYQNVFRGSDLVYRVTPNGV